jgi:hypothetical protein
MTLNSKPSESTEQRSETVHPDDGTNLESNLASGTPQIISHIPPPPNDTPRIDQGSDDHTPPWKKRLECAAILIAFGLLVVNIIALCATKKSADAAKSSAETAGQQLELAYRPWVYTDVKIGSPLTFDENRAHLRVDLTSRNDGNSPAINVYSTSELSASMPNSHKSASQIRSDFCGETVSNQNGQGIVLLPKSAPEEESWQLMSDKKDMKESASELGYQNGGFGAIIIVCTRYQSTIRKDRSYYFTDTAYHLLHVLPDKKSTPIFRIGDNILGDSLSTSSIFGGVGIR